MLGKSNENDGVPIGDLVAIPAAMFLLLPVFLHVFANIMEFSNFVNNDQT